MPNFNGQVFIPFFRQQYEQQQFYQPQLQQQQVDRSDQDNQHQGYATAASDYSNTYNSYEHGNDAGNSIGQDDDSGQQSHGFGDQSQQSHGFGDQSQQGHGFNDQQDYGAFTNFNAGGHESDNSEGQHDLGGGFEHQEQHVGHYVHSVPVSEHVEVSRPVAVPVYKEIGNSISEG